MTARKSAAGSPPAAPPPAVGRPLVFVDAIEGDRARLLLGIEAFEIPAALLPEGTKEGAWLRVGFEPAQPPSAKDDEGSSIRRRLERDDDGGDIKL